MGETPQITLVNLAFDTEQKKTAPEVKHNLVFKDNIYWLFMDELQDALKETSSDDLARIVEAASTDWVGFEPTAFGFKLPNKIAGEGLTGNGVRDNVPDIISPRHAFVSNACAELWLRRLEETVQVPRDLMGVRQPNLSKSAGEMRIVEKMADSLLQGIDTNELISKAQDKIAKKRVTYRQDSRLVNSDREILEEFTRNKADGASDQLKHLSASQDRVTYLLSSIRAALQDGYSMRLDASMAKSNSTEPININHFSGALQETWQRSLQRIVELNTEFSAVHKQTVVAEALPKRDASS
jgi:hypothetical protein